MYSGFSHMKMARGFAYGSLLVEHIRCKSDTSRLFGHKYNIASPFLLYNNGGRI